MRDLDMYCPWVAVRSHCGVDGDGGLGSLLDSGELLPLFRAGRVDEAGEPGHLAQRAPELLRGQGGPHVRRACAQSGAQGHVIGRGRR